MACQIVIGAGLEAIDFFVPGITGGKNQHRHRIASGAPLTQHLQTRPARQTQIKHYQRIRLGFTHELGIDAVIGQIDSKAGLFQLQTQVRAEPNIVFHQQQAHLLKPSFSFQRPQFTAACVIFELTHHAIVIENLQVVYIAAPFLFQFRFQQLAAGVLAAMACNDGFQGENFPTALQTPDIGVIALLGAGRGAMSQQGRQQG